MNFWLSPDDPTYFCIFLSLNAKNHALAQWPLIFWACALTECPSLLEGGPYTRIHFIFDSPPPGVDKSNGGPVSKLTCIDLKENLCCYLNDKIFGNYKCTQISFFHYIRSGEWEMAGGDGESLTDFFLSLALPTTTMYTPVMPKDCDFGDLSKRIRL